VKDKWPAAPAQKGSEQQGTDDYRRRHALCALQAVASQAGQPHLTLCGQVHTPHRRPEGGVEGRGKGLLLCPICFEIRSEHRAGCAACQQAGWTP
jgi:hypothetical protein